ncbi:MAG: hypothetical protein KDA72_10350 [Planctomycetales bacterium]|nr:hypothetical protein [Planctomycetales bacterium]
MLEGSELRPLLQHSKNLIDRVGTLEFNVDDLRKLPTLLGALFEAQEVGRRAVLAQDSLNYFAWCAFRDSIEKLIRALQAMSACDLTPVSRYIKFWLRNNHSSDFKDSEWQAMEIEAEIAIEALGMKLPKASQSPDGASCSAALVPVAGSNAIRETASFAEMVIFFKTAEGHGRSNSFYRRELKASALTPVPGTPARYYVDELQPFLAQPRWKLAWKKTQVMKGT